MKKWYIITGIICGMIICFSCKGKVSKIDDSITTVYCLTEELKKTTAIAPVSIQPVHEQITMSGKIEYNENDLLIYRSLLKGTVESVNFELGDYVHKGQVLATLHSEEAQELFQQKRLYETQVEMLKNELQLSNDLLRDGLSVKIDVLKTKHELEMAKISLQKVQQTLAMYRVRKDGYFDIISPQNGYIIQKTINRGQNITPESEPLFSISNLKQVWVMVNIYASNLREIKVGDTVKVRTVAYPDEIYIGKIDKIYNVFDDDEHVLKARVVLDNKNLQLMPGLSADIIVNKRTVLDSALAIPQSAVIFYNDREYIITHKSDCDLKVRHVHKIASNDEYYYVKEVLDPDERVVVTNVLLLFEELKNKA